LANLPSGSAIPTALAALLSIATAALPANTTIWYGAELPNYTAPLTFTITEITGDQTVAELGTQYRREEKFAFVCSLITYEGGRPDFDFSVQLSELMTNFNLIALAIGNNPDLNKTVRYAEVGNFSITAQTDGQGLAATILDFQVRCQQRVLSLS